MIIQAYSVYDRKALIYHPPFFTATDGAAVRVLSDEANNPDSMVGRHPADYVLFHVGTYSDQNGSLEPAVPIRHVADAQALVKVQQAFPGPFSETKPAVRPNGSDNHMIKEA